MIREYASAMDLIFYDSGTPDATLEFFAKVSSLMEFLRFGGPEWVGSPAVWFDFLCLPAGLNSAWHGSVMRCCLVHPFYRFYKYPFAVFYWCCVLVDHFERHVTLHCLWCGWLGEVTRALHFRNWKTWVRDLCDCADAGEVHISPCLCSRVESTQHQYNPRGHHAESILDDVVPDISIVLLHVGPHVLTEAFTSYLESGYRAKQADYPTFYLRLLKGCIQRTAASVFGSLDPFSLTNIVVNRFKGAESWDWMRFHPALREFIITNDLFVPRLVDVVANIVGIWPLVVSYLKDTGRKDVGDSLLVRSSIFGYFDLRHYNVTIAVLSFWRSR